MQEKTTSLPNKPFPFILEMIKPYKWGLGFSLFFAGSAQLADFLFAVYLGYLIDTISQSHGVSMWLWFLVALYPTITLFQALMWRAAGFCMMYVESGLNARIQTKLFSYLTDHGMEYFSNRFAGSISSKVSSASRGVGGIIDQLVWNYWTLVLSLVASLSYALWVNWKVASIVLVAAVVIVPANVYFARKKAVLAEMAEALRTKLRGSIVDSITNVAAMIHFAARKSERSRIDALINDNYDADIRNKMFTNLLILGNSVALFLFAMVVLLVSTYLWSSGAITVGVLITLLSMMSNLLWSLSNIGNQMNYFAESYGELSNGLDELVIPHDITDAPDAGTLRVDGGEIQFDSVKFGYGDKLVFDDFNLTIKPGQRIGLVGPSGAGKTTLVALLLRNTDVKGGAVRIDGADIRAVTQDSLHEAIAVVPQDPLLFHRTIRDNIAYGRPNATDEEVESAARKAEAHDFIVTLKDGYKTMVGERGIKLSGGQRQRIAIARAILKAAPVLILDEATSSLDSESESEIQIALQELMKGKTVVAIAHRLSTIKAMDRIIVMENGKIAEDGTHDELLQIKGGLYARLWAHQAGGFLEE